MQHPAATGRVVIERLVDDRPARATVIDRELVVGRAEDCGLVMRGPGVSRYHARLAPTNAGLRVRDLRSSNGTFLNGASIRGEVTARHGDVIRLGGIHLRVVDALPPAPPTPPVAALPAPPSPPPPPPPRPSEAPAGSPQVVLRRVPVTPTRPPPPVGRAAGRRPVTPARAAGALAGVALLLLIVAGAWLTRSDDGLDRASDTYAVPVLVEAPALGACIAADGEVLGLSPAPCTAPSARFAVVAVVLGDTPCPASTSPSYVAASVGVRSDRVQSYCLRPLDRSDTGRPADTGHAPERTR